jgi:hypothetical protein
MPLEKRIAMEKAESRARTGKPAASAGGFKKKPASAGGFKKKTTGRPKIAKNQRG